MSCPFVGSQYNSSHVYVSIDNLDPFTKSVLATFGGTPTSPTLTQVTPRPSSTLSQLIHTPVGMFSVFAYETPIPSPFGKERNSYMVANMDTAITSATNSGAKILVLPFADPIGRDAIIQWPGHIDMQLYLHDIPPVYPALITIPENRVYLSSKDADAFVAGWTRFSCGHRRRVSDDHVVIDGHSVRQILITSQNAGNTLILVSDFLDRLPYPFGQETTGYEVSNLDSTLARAISANVKVLYGPVTIGNRRSVMVEFPGKYVAEIHQVLPSRYDQYHRGVSWIKVLIVILLIVLALFLLLRY